MAKNKWDRKIYIFREREWGVGYYSHIFGFKNVNGNALIYSLEGGTKK